MHIVVRVVILDFRHSVHSMTTMSYLEFWLSPEETRMNGPAVSQLSRWVQFFYGAFGAGIQDIILFFSKRFSAPALEFSIVQYGLVVLVYCLAAGGVASIYPYRAPHTRWKAFIVGLLLPAIIGGLIATAQRADGGGFDVTVRGPPVVDADQSQSVKVDGDLLDLLALF